MMELVPPSQTATLSDRPDLLEQVRQLDSQAWPKYMYHAGSWQRCWHALLEEYPQFQIVQFNGDDQVVAVAHTVPATWSGKVHELPAGWDILLEQSMDARRYGNRLNVLAGLSVIVSPAHQGKGRSAQILGEMKNTALRHALEYIIVPVRPVLKSHYPLTPMERYIQWTRADGTAFDPWLRTHLRVGGEILGIAKESKTVIGTAAEWEEWAEMALPESGAYIIPGGLVPLNMDREADRGQYVEPNVWLLHQG